jgi:hypothetical protein
VVEWLDVHRSEGCTVAAMDEAAAAGHLEVVKYLHTNPREGCTCRAMDGAAGSGHLEVVRWLHVNRSEGCTVTAMDNASLSGHFDVVLSLHCERTEGCSTHALKVVALADTTSISRFSRETTPFSFERLVWSRTRTMACPTISSREWMLFARVPSLTLQQQKGRMVF